jgi:hypothetical protein
MAARLGDTVRIQTQATYTPDIGNETLIAVFREEPPVQEYTYKTLTTQKEVDVYNGSNRY